MVDEALVLRKLASLDDYRKQISEFSSVSLDGYRSDWKVQRIIERTSMISNCFQMPSHDTSE